MSKWPNWAEHREAAFCWAAHSGAGPDAHRSLVPIIAASLDASPGTCPCDPIQNRTRFYVHDNSKLINAPFVDNSYKWAGGGYLSTAEDLLPFGEGMINGDFLKPETVELLFTSQQTNSGEKTNYGLGWRSDELDGRRSVGHGGGSIGGSSYFIMFPAEKTVVAVICNLSGGNWGQPAKEILKLFTSKESFIKK